jgi:Tfp pilus assembly protein PilF
MHAGETGLCACVSPTYPRLMFKKKDYAKAKEFADKAIKIDPNYGPAYVNRGLANEMLRDMSAACEDWEKADKLGENAGQVYNSTNCGF